MSVLTLTPGRYTLGYFSNLRHGFGNWDLPNRPKPFESSDIQQPPWSEYWGITAVKLTDTQANRIGKYTAKRESATSLSADWVHVIERTGNDELWMGTPLGIDILKIDSTGSVSIAKWNDIESQPLIVSDIKEDRRGKIWMAGATFNPDTRSYGLTVETYDPRKRKVESLFQSFEHANSGNLLLSDNGDKWLWSYRTGLFQLVQKHGRYELSSFPLEN